MTPRLRQSILLWCAGMTGVIAVTVLVLPELLATLPEVLGREAPTAPLWMLSLASLIQSGVLVGLAVWLGSALASDVGLRAPVFDALANRRSALAALRPQWAPGLIGGILGSALLVAFANLAPPELRAAQARLEQQLVARVLYGGITEEILLRWAFMTLLVWLAWRLFQRRQGAPRTAYVWLAIAMSAIAFSLGHLPAAALLIGHLSGIVIVWVVVANTLFGFVFGYLYWRYGLEAAMIAHALTHALEFAVSRILP